MIEIKPNISVPANLPAEMSPHAEIKGVIHMGMHSLLRVLDTKTGIQYYHTLPTGHARQYPITFSLDRQKKYFAKAAKVWLAEPLIQSMLRPITVSPTIHQKGHAQQSKVILINCLDDCYGHVLYKLFNVQHHLAHHADFGLIVLIPTSLVWLVPPQVDEIWHIDLPLSQLNSWITSLDGFLKEAFNRFEAAYLSSASTWIDLSKVKIKLFTKASPLPLDALVRVSSQITFVCREDRFWLTSKWGMFFYLASRKFRITKYLKRYFVYQQNRKLRQSARLIAKEADKVSFVAVGIGKTGSLGQKIRDLRVSQTVSQEVERQWCHEYTQSLLVIGVHGSNMLLPTALSGGFINLLPDYKIPHMGEDVFFRHKNWFHSMLSVFLPITSPPSLVAKYATRTIKALPEYLREYQRQLSM